jgi:hypothetical protein
MDITYKEILWVLSVLITIHWNYFYIMSILKGKTKPHIYTRIIWAILMWIWFIIQMKAWWWPWARALWSWTIMVTIIVLLSIKYWTKDITKFDTILLILALLCILIYLWIDNKIYALLLIVSIDMLWYIPTFRKTIKSPFSEDLLTRKIFIIWNILSIIALTQYNILTVLYPAAIFVANNILVFIILYYRRQKQLWK